MIATQAFVPNHSKTIVVSIIRALSPDPTAPTASRLSAPAADWQRHSRSAWPTISSSDGESQPAELWWFDHKISRPLS